MNDVTWQAVSEGVKACYARGSYMGSVRPSRFHRYWEAVLPEFQEGPLTDLFDASGCYQVCDTEEQAMRLIERWIETDFYAALKSLDGTVSIKGCV